jgi:hypothetical protein
LRRFADYFYGYGWAMTSSAGPRAELLGAIEFLLRLGRGRFGFAKFGARFLAGSAGALDGVAPSLFLRDQFPADPLELWRERLKPRLLLLQLQSLRLGVELDQQGWATSGPIITQLRETTRATGIRRFQC